MHRGDRNKGEEYWVFPGGSLEEGESNNEGLLRELEEETTIKIKMQKLLYTHDYTTSEQHYYLCEYISGTPKLGESIELERTKADPNKIYEPMWVETSKLPELLLYPLEIRDWLLEDLKVGFQDNVREAKLKTSELRNNL